ncbi:MAG: alpha/beta hydrolase [Deltaproteobacteria bacterium]|nr:alpha/beta hydrolase [Deltaproteobacteria bacterium]
MRLLLAFILLLPIGSQAAKITKVSPVTINEGNITDHEMVTVEVLVDRLEPAFRLALRAFALSEDNAKYSPIQTGLPNSDSKPFKETIDVASNEGGNLPFLFIQKKFKVSFSPLLLPNGNNIRIGYVATAYSLDEKERFSELASPIRTVEVDGPRKRVVSIPKMDEDRQQNVEARIILDSGELRTEGRVTTYPLRVEDGSINVEQWNKKVAERQKEEPQALAAARTDVARAMAPKKERVYFATNRKVVVIRGQKDKYNFLSEVRGFGKDGVYWGSCTVDLPSREEEQSWWSSEKAKLINAYFYSERNFLNAISNSSSKDVFLFVHGYANSFESVVLQTARMKRDLDFKGNVMAYSWPSAGSTKSYAADQNIADGAPTLAAFDYVLEQVVMQARSQGGRVYLLSHSMGNRLMVHGLRQLYRNHRELSAEKEENRTIALLAFAAPDVDLNTFSSIIPSAVEMSQISTFYYSTKDRALALSEIIHDLNRAGLFPLFHDKLTTVNTDKIKTWFSLGHSYYTTSDRVLLDLFLQIRYHRPAPMRLPPLIADPAGEARFLFKHWFVM